MDPNTIKVVTAKNGDALYFSRQPIPSRTSNGLKQVCVIPFRRDFLFQYKTLEPTQLEIAESVDMLRILEHGFNVRMVLTDYETHSVDTPADLALVVEDHVGFYRASTCLTLDMAYNNARQLARPDRDWLQP